MIAARTIRCKVFAIGVPNNDEVPNTDPPNNVTEVADAASFQKETSAPRFRPSDLVPWADPYIAGLVRRLQSDVRKEVAAAERPVRSRFGAPVADLEWPWDGGDADVDTVDMDQAEDLNWDQRF